MLKKTIYSAMALSLTLMLAPDVMADWTGGPMGANVTIQDGNKWTGTETDVTTNSGYTMSITGENNVTSTASPLYQQTDGRLELNNGVRLKLIGKLGTDKQSNIIGGTVSLQSTGNWAILTVAYGAGIDKGVEVIIDGDNTINLIDSASGLSNDASLILNSGTGSSADTWDGIVNVTGNGILELDGYNTANRGAKSVYHQDGGTLVLAENNDKFALDKASDFIYKGKVTISSGSMLDVAVKAGATGQALKEDGSTKTLDLDYITLGKKANVNIQEDGTLSLTSTGTAVLDYDTDAGTIDTWDGAITVGDTSELTMYKRTDETGAKKTYNQSGGTLNLGDTNAASSLTLKTGASKITAGNVNINKGSTLVFDNGLTTNAATIKTDGSEGNTLTIGNTSKLTANSGSSIDYNANVNITGTLDISTDATVNLNDMRAKTDPKGNPTYQTEAITTTGDTWDGSISLSGGTLNLSNVRKLTDGNHNSVYNQTGGTLTLADETTLWLIGDQVSSKSNKIIDGNVNVGTVNTDSTINTGNTLVIDEGSQITNGAKVTIYAGNQLTLIGNIGAEPSLVINNSDSEKDVWQGEILVSGNGVLSLQGFDNSEYSADRKTAVYQQDGGTINISSLGLNNSYLQIDTDTSYIQDGVVVIDKDNTLHISVHNSGYTDPETGEFIPFEALLGDITNVNLKSGGKLKLTGTGTAILNDNTVAVTGSDIWSGDVIVGSGPDGSGVSDKPVLTLKNVTKDFTNPDETGTLTFNSGTVNVYGNANGGSHITIYDTGNDKFKYTGNGGNSVVNVRGNDANTLSTFTTVVTKDGEITNAVPLNLQGNAEIEYKLNGHNATISNVVPTGSGPNNTMVQSGNGTLNLYAPGADLNMGYNLRVENGVTNVDARTMTIGTVYGGTPYGYLQIGMPGNPTETHFYTNALRNNIYGDMSLNNAWYHTTNPNSLTTVGGNLHTGSGIDMMYGKINSINVAGVHTVDNLKLKIDVDPATYRADTINAAAVVANPNSTLDLVDYKLLSEPRRDKYTFRVVNAANEKYSIGAGAKKIVSQNKITWTKLGGYQMIPSSVKGAFDMVVTQYNPQIFRGQVAANVIYANQMAITNQLFDRMIYSNLPYFNDDCSNKTAAANTLFSPYQYSTNDTGLWFKPYANFETIRMSYVGNVRNNAYGAMIGADFAKKKWGEWSFIPSAFIGYNGGHSTYRAVGMWHNGGQGGLMGTLTRKNFVTSMAVYAGGYHNVMNVGGFTDRNALWNVGVASKTAYNIPLFWDLILQPTLYMAYNYVGGSDFDSNYEGYTHKVHSLNAYSIAPGLNLIWQKETFNIYALFQAMFNINAVSSGQIAEIDLPHIGIRDPYFEYGLGFSKFFKDRFSGYGQAVARSGSRKGVGFQLGLNMKL